MNMASSSGKLDNIPGWLYAKLTSLRVSIYILALLAFFYLLGTIFPQGGELEAYKNAGGKYVLAVRIFDLLNLFTSPIFLILAFIFFLNLLLCTYERLLGIISLKRPLPVVFVPGYTIPLTLEKEEAEEEMLSVLRGNMGFRVLSLGREWTVMERGLSYRWLTWLYHAGIVVCFVGFLLTYLFSVEDMITLYPKKPTTIKPSTAGRLESMWKDVHDELDFKLMLDEFITEYTQSPDLKYPKDKTSRLALALGWQDPTYEINEESLFPKDWKSRLRVQKGGLTVYEKTIEVNDPLVYEGYTFYQMAFEQKLKVRVDRNPILLEAEAGGELLVPGLETPLRFGTLRTGTLFRLDGGIETITPFVMVKRSKRDEKGTLEKEELGKLELGGTLVVDNKRIQLMDVEEASVLSYRYDPGVPLLWWGGIFVFVTMTLRCFGGWYLLAYKIEESEGIAYLVLSVTTKGLGASDERIAKRIEYYLTRSEIRPTPLPPNA